MTREDAIDVLKHNYPSACFTDLCEAVEMAIEALEENESLAKSLNDAVELIHKLQKKNEWIPCANHLPKEGDLVLLWDADKFPSKKYVLCEFRENYGFYNWNEGIFIAEYDGANAWMPLPKPWKGEEDE